MALPFVGPPVCCFPDWNLLETVLPNVMSETFHLAIIKKKGEVGGRDWLLSRVQRKKAVGVFEEMRSISFSLKLKCK